MVGGPRAFRCAVLVVVLLPVGLVGGQPEPPVSFSPPHHLEDHSWGLWVGSQGDSFNPDGRPYVHLCVQSEGPVRLAFPDDGAYRSFSPRPDAPDCQPSPGGVPLTVAEATGEVRVAVLRGRPFVMERPGAVDIAAPGEAVLVPAGSARSTTMLHSGPDIVQVALLPWPQFTDFVLRSSWNDNAGQALLFVVVDTPENPYTIEWRDPGWFDRAPRLGVVLAVVALALLVTLYRGTPGRSFVPVSPRRRG